MKCTDIEIDSLIPFDVLRTDLEHVFSIVDENDNRYSKKLYASRNCEDCALRERTQDTRIRARCGHYPDMFEALLGNYIKLKEDEK